MPDPPSYPISQFAALHPVDIAIRKHQLVAVVHPLHGRARLARAVHVARLHALVDERQQVGKGNVAVRTEVVGKDRVEAIAEQV